MNFEIFLKETDVCFASLNTLLYSAACCSSHELPCRFIPTNCVYRNTVTSLRYNLSQGKLHSLATWLQQLWSPDTGSTSSTLLDTKDQIVLLEGCRMFSLSSSALLLLPFLILFVLIYLEAHSGHLHLFLLKHTYVSLFGWLTTSTSKGVINQSKAAQSFWQLWQNGEVDQGDAVCQANLWLSFGMQEGSQWRTVWLMTLQVMAICCPFWNVLAWSVTVINAKNCTYLSGECHAVAPSFSIPWLLLKLSHETYAIAHCKW